MNKKRLLIILAITIVIAILVIAFWPFKSISQDNYEATEYLIADIDHDGQDEMAVVVWKRGYYGPDLPFWETENIDDYGNHLFIYEIEPEVKMKWGSSTINYKIKSLDFRDQYLIVNNDEQWLWEGFGFRKI